MISHVVLYSILSASTPAAPATSDAALAIDPVAVFAATPAPAEEESVSGFSYTYIEANYKWFKPDVGDEDFDGFEIKGSLELFLNIFLEGSWATLEDDSDLDIYRLGAGWHLPIGETFDVYGTLSYASHELDSIVDDFDEDGLAAVVGGRFWIGPKFELNGKAEWLDLDESDVGFGLGGRWYFANRLSAGLGVEFLDSDETYFAGLRFSF